jgi:hypothetical protein
MLQRALHTRSDAGVRLLSVTVAPRRSNRRTRASKFGGEGPDSLPTAHKAPRENGATRQVWSERNEMR